MPAKKTLDIIAELNPEVTTFVLQLHEEGASEERIGQELFAKFNVSLSRWAIHSWLADQTAVAK